METEDPTAERIFARLSGHFTDLPDVTTGTGFGSSPGLRVGGKIFAMVVHNELVVKLAKARVDELVEAGTAERFDRGKGQRLKEWAATPTQHAGEWEQLMAEALEFVRSGNRRGSRKTNRSAASRRN